MSLPQALLRAGADGARAMLTQAAPLEALSHIAAATNARAFAAVDTADTHAIERALAAHGARAPALVHVQHIAHVDADLDALPQRSIAVLHPGLLARVLDQAARQALLARCVAAAPGGVVVILPRATVPRASRATALGTRMGCALRALSGGSGAPRALAWVGEGARRALVAVDVDATVAACCRTHGVRRVALPEVGALWLRPHTGRVTLDDAALDLMLDVLRRGRAQTLRVRGSSMRGTIPDGARVVLLPVSGPVALGTVVATKENGGPLLVHRLIGRDAHGNVLTRGDACPAPDAWVPAAAVCGVVHTFQTGDADGDDAQEVPARPVPPRALLVRAWGRVARSAHTLWRPIGPRDNSGG